MNAWEIVKSFVAGMHVERESVHLQGYGRVPLGRVLELLPALEDLGHLGAPRAVVLGQWCLGEWGRDEDPAGVSWAAACLRRVRGEIPESWRAVTSTPRQVFLAGGRMNRAADYLRRFR